MKFLIMQYFPVSYYFIPLGSKYYPLHHILPVVPANTYSKFTVPQDVTPTQTQKIRDRIYIKDSCMRLYWLELRNDTQGKIQTNFRPAAVRCSFILWMNTSQTTTQLLIGFSDFIRSHSCKMTKIEGSKELLFHQTSSRLTLRYS
jgi:hypothetical protein